MFLSPEKQQQTFTFRSLTPELFSSQLQSRTATTNVKLDRVSLGRHTISKDVTVLRNHCPGIANVSFGLAGGYTELRGSWIKEAMLGQGCCSLKHLGACRPEAHISMLRTVGDSGNRCRTLTLRAC